MIHNLGGAIKPLYNGNISETFWKTDSDNVIRNYGYQYDNLNRLTASIYQRNGFETHSYDETLNYDKNGNIKWLNRNGYVDNPAPGMTYTIDDLTYTYGLHTNRLDVVHDNSNSVNGFRDGNRSSTDYEYDDNGNMTIDRNKGIQNISYNHLNLPVEITFSNDRKISYLYNALGTKIRKRVIMPTQVETTDYLGGFQYKNEDLQYFPTAEGYVNVTDRTFFNYVYNYTDHLGNIRLSYTQSGTELKILEENHYYPFGLKHNNYNTDKVQFKKSELGTSAVLQFAERNNNQYKYNGKEYQDELGLNTYDYGFRQYMPDIGRTTILDPLAEKFYNLSPQSFLNNNPLRFIDPTGMASEDFQDPQKKKGTAVQRAYNHKNGTTDGLKIVANLLSDANSYVKEKISLSDKDINSSVTSKNGGDKNQKTKHDAKQKGDNTDMTGVVEGAPNPVTSFKGNDFLDFVKAPSDLFDLGQRTGESINEVVKENRNKKGKVEQDEYVNTGKDSKTGNNNLVRRDVLEAQQKKKNDEK